VAVDTSRTIEIEKSPVKLIFAVIGCLMFVALGGAIAFGYIPTDPRAHVRWIGWFCLAFFGLCAAVALWRLTRKSGPLVTIAPQGIRDTRVSADFIPWRAIRNVTTWQMRQTKVVVLAVDPAVERGLSLTRAARWTRRANAAVGADGLCVAALDLKVSHAALIEAVMSYWQTYRGR
jgi:hypothetical protein